MTLKALSDQHRVEGERQVLITEVTRMSGGQVCVAGIDIQSGVMVRPLMPDGSNWDERAWVDENFHQVGNLLSFRPAIAGHPAYPHATEDFRVAHVTLLATSSSAELYAACVETADGNIDDIFDGQLIDGKYVVADSPCRSLGCVLVNEGKIRVSAPFGSKVQVSYRDDCGTWHNLSVTELWTKNQGAPEVGAEALAERLNVRGGAVALRLGLARAWDGGDQGFDPKRCYLQLNGLILPA